MPASHLSPECLVNDNESLCQPDAVLMTTGDLDSEVVHRNRDAVPLYALMLGGLSLPLVLLLSTSRRQWDFIGAMLLIMAALLRYLLPGAQLSSRTDGCVTSGR